MLRDPSPARATEPKPASIGHDVIARLASEIYDAERHRTTLTPLTERYPGIGVADAYGVQQLYARMRTEAGARLIGQKIGATSKAIQELFGIDTPDYGHLFDDMLCDEHQPIATDRLIQPLTEPEIAFILGDDISGPGISPEDVVDASQGVVACLEIIDSRIEGWRIRLEDTIADNGSSARFVVGSEIFPLDDRDLAAEPVTLLRNGEVVGRGNGSAVLGHPAASAAWLANALGAFGESLPAGSYVLSGSMTTAVAARPGDRFEARFGSIGRVSCAFAAYEGDA